MGSEPAYALGKAQAQFGLNRPADALATLDDLKAQWPDFESAEGHLLYARSLAEVGRIDEALDEYHALVQAIFPVRRHGSATACCYVWRAATPRPESYSTNCCCR